VVTIGNMHFSDTKHTKPVMFLVSLSCDGKSFLLLGAVNVRNCLYVSDVRIDRRVGNFWFPNGVTCFVNLLLHYMVVCVICWRRLVAN